MHIELRFFATFREAVGQRDLDREYADGLSIGELLAMLEEEYADLEFFTERGDLREYLSIMRNGRDITHLDGVATPVEDGDTISLFPPVAGGRGSRVVRSFRGISQRAAFHYLDRLGGDRIDEDTVVGEGWRATVSTEQVGIGPSLQLTEVTVRFEGRGENLDGIIEAFARKAMRAGG